MVFWAFLLSLSFYPGPFGVLAWVSLIRPFMILSKLDRRTAFTSSYLFGFFFTGFCIYWVALVTPAGTLAAVAIVGLYYAVMLYVFNRVYQYRPLFGIIAAPFLWVGLEHFRTLSQFAFPWFDLGYTQSYFLYVLQIVSVISVHGLSLVILAVNVLLWQVFRKDLSAERRLTAGLVSVAVVALTVAYGWIVTPPLPLPGKLPVAVMQGSVGLEEKWVKANEGYSMKLYDSLARSVTDSGIELYVWPETALPSYLSHSFSDRNKLSKLARETNAYHLVGGLGAYTDDSTERHYNSCYQFLPDGRMARRYDKVRLVPFSETVPYQDALPFLRRDVLTEYLTFIETYGVQWWSDFYPGDSLLLFEMDTLRYAVMICFESTFPEYNREAILKGADFLVGTTNDTWFGRSVGVHMHSQIFLTRLVENRSWGVRAANSGISYIADGYGRIRQELGLYEVGVLTGKVRTLDGFSTFTRIGDVAGKVSLLITVGVIGILFALWLVRKFSPASRS